MEYKDKRIKEIVKNLQDKFGADNIVVKDHWDGDNCAIGLTNKDDKNIVYISTYKKKNNEYLVELECPAENENEEYKNCGSFDIINIDRVEEIVKTHLRLK